MFADLHVTVKLVLVVVGVEGLIVALPTSGTKHWAAGVVLGQFYHFACYE